MPGILATVSYPNLISELDEVATWLRGMGIDESRTRIGEARLADDTVFTWCQQYAMAIFPNRDPAAVRVAQAVEAAMREATAQEGTLWL
jgi:hypothetical protein